LSELDKKEKKFEQHFLLCFSLGMSKEFKLSANPQTK